MFVYSVQQKSFKVTSFKFCSDYKHNEDVLFLFEEIWKKGFLWVFFQNIAVSDTYCVICQYKINQATLFKLCIVIKYRLKICIFYFEEFFGENNALFAMFDGDVGPDL